MGGCAKTSTRDVTASALPSPCSKSKAQESASAATPTLSGHLMISLLVIVVRCCSTCLGKGTSQTKEQATIYTVAGVMALVFMEVVTMSYVHILNHFMVMVIAGHFQINLVIVSQVLVQTCSLTSGISDLQ
jgi:hypothetical protein